MPLNSSLFCSFLPKSQFLEEGEGVINFKLIGLVNIVCGILFSIFIVITPELHKNDNFEVQDNLSNCLIIICTCKISGVFNQWDSNS